MKSFWKFIEGEWAKNLANRLSIPKERSVQNALDYERLFIACKQNEALHARAASLRINLNGISKQSIADAWRLINHQSLVMEARATSFPQQKKYVDHHIHSSLHHMALAMHQSLQKEGDLLEAAGRLLQVSNTADPDHKSTQPGRHISLQQLSQLIRHSLGFSLRVAPSKIDHPDAGRGVFLEGTALPGTLIALVPGLTYSRTQYKRMPNFPRIDIGNPYLSRTYEMDVIDSKPWGDGDQTCSPRMNMQQEEDSSNDLGGLNGRSWVQPTCPEARLLEVLEGRHPLAVGHMINHPEPGMQPNVLEVGFDWTLRPGEEPWLRVYIPNLPLVKQEEEEEDNQVEEISVRTDGDIMNREEQLRAWCQELLPGKPACKARGIALIATKFIKDGEEILQNYRLNPWGPRPLWYHPVNVEEDERRWAQLPLINVMAPPRSKL
ncbi:hypothetical protein CEUSTIGMA_g7084.t1 [Chlamydomonas eustigma]|uniref:SET domain-containing protein n=1 Tax=Chlamydomonas eustigma TaxID=1157962 RepID=A0A250X984_9CHLO|nr:hypothetical protein CEUSTIGMA_g7084.t1 [Chlamydomonas eustigma]|eukprot:GAX79643.1 hypothetical protein CEUSTIGMA_g7084.t1 [Chlamydomonas eustigma]